MFAQNPKEVLSSQTPGIGPIKLIPKGLHEQIFNSKVPENYVEDETAVERLSELQIPVLRSEHSVFEHFQRIGQEQLNPYEKLLEIGLKIAEKMPMKPPKWQMKVGWVKYTADGFESIEAPDEDVLFFDVEVCAKDGQLPS